MAVVAEGAPNAAPGLFSVFWDIENESRYVNHATALKRALQIYLKNRGFPRGRMDITAYHDPRRQGALTEKQVEGLALVPVRLCDKGSKKGLADHLLARDCRNLADDASRFGLRVSCVVVISSDSDYCAAGVYDAVNDAGIPLLIVHSDVVKASLLQTANELGEPMRSFVHVSDLMSLLPALPGPGPAPPAPRLVLLQGPGAMPPTPEGQQRPNPNPFPHPPGGNVGEGHQQQVLQLGFGLQHVPSTGSEDDSQSLANPISSESHPEAFQRAVHAFLTQNHGTCKGSALGAYLRSVGVSFVKLIDSLSPMDGRSIDIHGKGMAGDIVITQRVQVVPGMRVGLAPMPQGTPGGRDGAGAVAGVGTLASAGGGAGGGAAAAGGGAGHGPAASWNDLFRGAGGGGGSSD